MRRINAHDNLTTVNSRVFSSISVLRSTGYSGHIALNARDRGYGDSLPNALNSP